MHEKSLIAIVVTKWAELLFQFVLTSVLIAACAKLIIRLDGQAPYLQGMSVVSCILAFFHLMHNTLLTNLRFACKKNNHCCGKFFYDFCNYLLCTPCLLGKLCSEKKTWLWVLKWAVLLGFNITLIVLLRKYQKSVVVTD